VLFEGGGRLTSALLEARQLDYLLAYRAPVILADEAAVAPFSGAAPDFIQQGWRLEDVRHAIFGDDQLLRGRLRF
jgi:diaminohydroxyphosphoribosylaminopyrimidine deaminase/5-amino-6-(5-phosphoribosylamino)uracil reductase